jgi:PadR family transcriptional regulator, regulatory protein PadR
MMPVSGRHQPMRIDQFGKDLATGSYDLVLLDILSGKPAYAYGIVREIFEKSKGTTRWHEGTVYHVLHHLEKQGFVIAYWQGPKTGRRRKYYRLTPRGHQALAARRKQWQRFSHDLNALLGL